MVKTRSSARLASIASGSQETSSNEELPDLEHLEKRLKLKKTVTKTAKKVSSAPRTVAVAPVVPVAPVSVINYTSSTLPTLPRVPPQPLVAPQPQLQKSSHFRPITHWYQSEAGPAVPPASAAPPHYMLEALKAGGGYPVHPDVRFRRLPFYQESAEVMRPSTLVPMFHTRMQENTFYFHLTPQQAQTIMNSPELNSVQVQLRFCLVETSCEQDDCFPPNCSVKINNKLCPLPMPIPTNKCGVEPKRPPGPVNITALLKLSPTVANTIVIYWGTDFICRYAVCVSLVRRLTPTLLLNRLKNKGTKNPDFTRSLIKEKLREDLDCEIATTSLRVSLVCPLGKMRMVCPCRPVTCLHLQCFDASLFLLMNERKPTWLCPVCDKPALYDSLVVDGYFQEVLNSPRLASDCSEIQLHKDGSWSAHTKTEIIPEKVFNDIEVIQDDMDIIPLSDGSESSTGLPGMKRGCGSRDGFPDQPSPRPAPPTTVDLTSDSDDDLPLRRKAPRPPDTAESSNDTFSNLQRNRSLDLAVSSIISLDSPSPLALPASPGPDSNEPPMEVETLDPTLDLDDPDETTEALKQISSDDHSIEIVAPPISKELEITFETPIEFSPQAGDETLETLEDKSALEDPIEISVTNNLEDIASSDRLLEEEPSGPAELELAESLEPENPIDIVNNSSTEMPDPLEIEEPLSNESVEASSPEGFDDNDDSLDFLKDTVNSLEKSSEVYPTEISKCVTEDSREEVTSAEVENIPQAIMVPHQLDSPQPDSEPNQQQEPLNNFAQKDDLLTD